MERELLRAALEALGHEVISSADGAEARLAYLQNRDTRVVIATNRKYSRSWRIFSGRVEMPDLPANGWIPDRLAR
jgi:CheY-like chemotaxis protein